MNRRKFIGRAVLCAAAGLWIGGAFADGRIVAVDQASTSAVIIAGNKVTWRWTPQSDRNVKPADRAMFAAIDECKVCDAGATLLVNASCGGVAAIDIAKTNVIWYARASRGNAGPHSVCRLPDGCVAVANSTGCDALEIIDVRKAPLDPARQRLVRAAEIPGAHGVDWNLRRHSLFVLGYTNLYEFAYLSEKMSLVELRRWPYDKVLGDAYGHDLVPDAKGGYFITNHSGVWRIDLETGLFSSVLARKNAKSFSRDSVKGDLMQLPTERFWSDRLVVVRPDGTDRIVGPFPGAKFYKARWFSSDARQQKWPDEFNGSSTGLDGISYEVPKARPCDALSKDGLKGLWLEGEPWKGKPTWVFAYLALPVGASASNRVPGIVLAHGGGGTAYPSWPKTWTRHGYAAIVVDTCGHLPFKAPGQKWNEWIGSGVGGPHGWGRADLGRKPASDQWPYHAVGALVRAHSYLRSLPEVDPGKTGLTGISWGGFLTMLAAGVDGRFKFAMPVYACAYCAEMERVGGLAASVRGKLPPDAVARWDELFDPLHYVPRMKMPVFWFASSNDTHFPFDILQRTVRLVPTMPGLAIRVNMVHSHGPHGENMPELFRFADQVVRGAPPLPAVGEPKAEKAVLSVTVDRRGNAIKRVDLNWCADDPPAATSVWNVVRHPAPLGGIFRAPVPAPAKRVYVNFVLEGVTGEPVYPESIVSSPSVATWER